MKLHIQFIQHKGEIAKKKGRGYGQRQWLYGHLGGGAMRVEEERQSVIHLSLGLVVLPLPVPRGRKAIRYPFPTMVQDIHAHHLGMVSCRGSQHGALWMLLDSNSH